VFPLVAPLRGGKDLEREREMERGPREGDLDMDTSRPLGCLAAGESGFGERDLPLSDMVMWRDQTLGVSVEMVENERG
jgi:hypothetical protein